MKKKLLTLFFITFISISSVFSATLYSRTSTGFYNAGTWSTMGCGGVSCGCSPTAADNIVICAGQTVTCNTAIVVGPGGNCASITIQNGGTLNMEPSGVLTVKNGGFLTVNAGGNLFVDVFINNNNSDGVILNGTLTVSTSFDNGVGADIAGSGTISMGTGSTFTNDGTIMGVTVLPVELLSFTGEAKEKTVDLFWTTASEINNDYFAVERSKDGFTFENIGTIDGAGNSNAIINYSFTDNSPVSGVAYYRLKQTDHDGNYKYSDLVSVEFKNTNEFSFEVFPNPTTGEQINISLNTGEQEETLVVVYDVTGQQSYSKVFITATNGKNVYAIDPSNRLNAGVYLITATSKDKVYSKRLIIQ